MSWEFAEYEFYLSATLLICAMFGMGATLTVQDFRRVARAPQGILLILAMQVLITPCLAVGLVWLFALPHGMGVGLLLIAALPGGMFSNVLTYFGRGNVALSVSATAIATVACLATTSLVLKVFGSTQLPDDFSMPVGQILTDIILYLLLPLSLGMLVRRSAHRHHETIAKMSLRLSFVILILFAIGALTSGRIEIVEYGWRTPAALVLFSLIAFWLSYILGYLINLSANDSFTVGVECVVRNVQLGLLLKASLFPAAVGKAGNLGDAVLYVLLFYGASCLIIAGLEVVIIRSGLSPIVGRSEEQTDESSSEPLESAKAR